ncbi:MAG: MFS transporter [Pseudomonadales bacterium]|jgi:MFS family permease|nr:MFS transporter [Pseudomonadales bacterium]
MTLPPRWPFDVRRLPFFYGWVIWVVSLLGFLMSIPGQTMGMAVFTDDFIDAFGLSRTQLSLAYLFGTVASSLFLQRAGRWYDRHGARLVIVGSALLLGATVLAISVLDHLVGLLRHLIPVPDAWLVFPLILLCYFGVRFAGQGVLTSASRNLLLLWFDRRRGLVSGVRGVFVSLGFSVAPLALSWLIALYGWRGALGVLALVAGFGFAVLALLLVRDSPEACGVLPDGAQPGEPAPAWETPDLTVAVARRSPVFWIYALGLAAHALFGTAFTFHVVDLFAEAGRSRSEAFGYFLPAAIVSTSVNLLASWVVDGLRLKPFLLLMLVAFMAGTWGTAHLAEDWGYWLLAGGYGVGGGLWGVLSNLAYVRFFGRLHLGEISGLSAAVTVFASAIGPALFALGKDLTGSYRGVILFALLALAGLLAAALRIPQREPRAGA